MTDQQQRDLRRDEVEAGSQSVLGLPSVDVTDARQNSLWSDAWASLKRNPLFWIGAVLGVFFVLMAAVPQIFARGADPRDCDLTNSKLPPTGAHWFGYDQQGCDYLANVAYGARSSLAIGLISVAGVLVIGVVVGAVAGYYGGFADSLLARLTDIFFAIPLILGAIILLKVGPSTGLPVISDRGVGAVAAALALFGWMTAMRLVRSQVIAVKSSDYVAAARAMGASNFRILTRHILPNAVAPVLVFSTITVGVLIAAEATLTYLGVGLQRPAADRDGAVAAPDRTPPGALPEHRPVPDSDGVHHAGRRIARRPRPEAALVSTSTGSLDSHSPLGTGDSAGPVLEVDDLYVEFRTRAGVVNAVNGISYSVDRGDTLAILGESGSGKSVSAQAIMGILDTPPAVISGGGIRFQGRDMLTMHAEDQRKIRGPGIAMIFQDALSALNPVYSVGFQIGEMFRAHRGTSRKEAKQRAVELMDRVRIPAAARRVNDYPHQFSGGMRQRVMIAMALALDPRILIADEPTTALDVTVQAQVMDLLKELQRENGMGLILITHDLGVVNEVADRVAVMYAGKIVETGTVDDVFTRPSHPYTLGLMNSIPQVESKGGRLNPIVGQPPNLSNIPSGCPFHPRCPRARTGPAALPGRDCVGDVPPLRLVVPGRQAACHYSEEVLGV
jgi:oligopeptide transport system ATP-binding protein